MTTQLEEGRIKNYILVGELNEFLKDVPDSWRVNIDINSENDWVTLSTVWWGKEPEAEPTPDLRLKSITVWFPTSYCQRCHNTEIAGSWGYCGKCKHERELEENRDKEALRIGREILKTKNRRLSRR